LWALPYLGGVHLGGVQRPVTADLAPLVDWPHRYLAAEVQAGRIDARTVLTVLTHDPKFDFPVLEVALPLPALGNVDAMGSRRTQGLRRRRDPRVRRRTRPRGATWLDGQRSG
jgi:hypothetical protein